MTTVDFITTLICRVDDRLSGVAKHAQIMVGADNSSNDASYGNDKRISVVGVENWLKQV